MARPSIRRPSRAGRAALAGLWLWLAAAVPVLADASGFLPPVPPTLPGDPLAFNNPGDKVLLIYLPGSDQEFFEDRCTPRRPESAWGVPPIIAELAGQRVAGRQIAIYGFCTPTLQGDYDARHRRGTPKVVYRSRDLAALLKAFRERGLNPEQTFLIGHSAGAWTSLLVARENPGSQQGVIAFAPAFAGTRADRTAGWDELRDSQIAYLSEAGRLDALVYGFEDDPFNRPQDLEFLIAIPGVVFRALPSDSIARRSCTGAEPHHLLRHGCFEAEQGRILSYIRDRLQSR